MLDPLRAQGIARTSTLRLQGWTKHGIAKSLATGELVRPRRGWVARPDADPELMLAAQHGVLLSCVTQAKRLGLWTPSASEPHFSARQSGARQLVPGCVMHWGQPIMLRDPDALEDTVENVLDTIARCQPFEHAVAIWNSALNKGAVDRAVLSRLPLRAAARRVLAEAQQFADSGLESYVRLRLSWLRVRIVPQAWLLGHRVDFLLGDLLVLQIDGGHHVGPQRTEDNRHDAELKLRGYTVLRVGYAQVMFDWPAVQQRIMQAVAQGLHVRGAA